MATPVQEVTQTFQVGLNTVVNEVESPPGLQWAENAWVSQDDFGAVESVPGFSKIVAADFSEPLSKVYFAKSSTGVRIAVAVGQTQVWSVDLDPGFGHSVTQIKTGLTPDKEMSITALNDTLYFFNGVDTPWKATIASPPVVSDMGLTRPSVTASAASRITHPQTFHLVSDEDEHIVDSSGNHLVGRKEAEGEVVGVVKYFVATMSTTTESALSAAFGEVDAQSGSKIRVTGVPLGSTGIAKIYRTYANRENPWFHHTEEGAVDGTADFTDNTPDEALRDAPYRHGDTPPAGITSVVSHFNRIFGLAGNLLYFSDLDDAESFWTATNGYVINVMGDDGDIGVALARDSEGVVIYKRNHLYRLLGRIPEDFYLVEVTLSDPSNRSIGVSGVQALAYFPGGIVFYWNRGIYIYQGGRAVYISAAIEDVLNNDYLDQKDHLVAIGYHPTQKTVWVSVPMTRLERNTHTFLYSVVSNRWVGMMTQGFRGYSTIENKHGDLALWASGSFGFR